MTDKVNPSINRPAEAFKTAGAIALAGGSSTGWISPAASPSDIAVQDTEITEGNLNAFAETSSGASLDVDIDAGEAFIYGSWVAIDTVTTVTLTASTSNQTVYVGWNKDSTDDVIVGLDAAFQSASGNTDKKIPLFDFDTDGSGVTAVTDRRVIGGNYWSTLSVSSNTTASRFSNVLADASGGSIDITLPVVDEELMVTVKKSDASGNSVDLITPNSETIDGQASISLTNQYESRTITSDGTNYFII